MWPAIAGAPRVGRARLGGPVPMALARFSQPETRGAECHRGGIFRPALGSRSRPRGPHEYGHLTTCDRRVRLGVAREGEPARNGQLADRQARPGRLSSIWRFAYCERRASGRALGRSAWIRPAAGRTPGLWDRTCAAPRRLDRRPWRPARNGGRWGRGSAGQPRDARVPRELSRRQWDPGWVVSYSDLHRYRVQLS